VLALTRHVDRVKAALTGELNPIAWTSLEYPRGRTSAPFATALVFVPVDAAQMRRTRLSHVPTTTVTASHRGEEMRLGSCTG
jgi:hypothetical protein